MKIIVTAALKIILIIVLLFSAIMIFVGNKLPAVIYDDFLSYGELLEVIIRGEDSLSPVEKIPPEERRTADLILLGARKEVKNGTVYDASYVDIVYPRGDVPPDRGACTDVIIRAFRNAGIDLQELIHEDMKENFDVYPKEWGLEKPDTNIDHRRVPNQMKFFERYALPL